MATHLMRTEPPPADDTAIARPPRRRHPLRWLALGIGLVLVIVIGVLAAAQLGAPTLADSPLLGKAAPVFDLPSLDGDARVRSADYAGRIYIANFWASWCVPCREEAPNLQSFHERRASHGADLVGILFNDTEDAARAFRDEFGLTYPLVVDPDGKSMLAFGVTGIPETFFVDDRGIVMAKLIGAVGPDTLDRIVTQIRAGKEVTDQNDRYQQQP